MPMLVKNSSVLKNVASKPRREARWGCAAVFQMRGQAMLEYSVLNWLLIVALVLGCTVRVIPGPERKKNLIELFFNAFQVQYDSYYFLLNSALP